MTDTSHEVPVQLARDYFRHEPAGVRFLSPDLGSLARVVQSRMVIRKGMLIELSPPLGRAHLFSVGGTIQIRLRLPYQDESFVAEGEVNRILLNAIDPEGNKLSVLSLRFTNLEPDAIQRLEAHQLALDSTRPELRSPRIPVNFVVEPQGIDVMSNLTALDMSMTGMFVGGRAKFPKGKVLNLGFRLPFQRRRVSLSAKVVWLGQKTVPGREDESKGFGLQFLQMPGATRAALVTYYARWHLDVTE